MDEASDICVFQDRRGPNGFHPACGSSRHAFIHAPARSETRCAIPNSHGLLGVYSIQCAVAAASREESSAAVGPSIARMISMKRSDTGPRSLR